MRIAARSTRSASRWPPRRAVASGARHSDATVAWFAASRVSSAASSASVPPRRTATELTTGMPSSRSSAAMSISMPRLRAMSIMFRDISTGRPTCFSSSARRSASRRLEASRDANDQVGRTLGRELAQHRVARDLLVRRAGAQRIGARQVDDLDRPAGGRREAPDLLLDRHAGIVGDLLAAAGEGVEQRRLAAVGIADQRDDGSELDDGVHDWSVTITAMASRRRSAIVVAATRTAIGSPPNRP